MNIRKTNTVAAVLAVVCLFNHGPIPSDSAKLPDKFPQCSRSDPELQECVRSAIEEAYKFMKDGIPSLQLFPIDPLAVSRIIIDQGANRTVHFKLDMKDAQLFGMSDVKVLSSSLDLNTRTYDATLNFPMFIFKGDYELDGKFLEYPLKGKGKFQMVLSSTNNIIKISSDTKTKNGNLYWDVKSFSTVITSVKNFRVIFENLFNGDKVLGDSTNKALNDNWEVLWEQLRPQIEENFGQIFLTISKLIHSKVPEKDIFLN